MFSANLPHNSLVLFYNKYHTHMKGHPYLGDGEGGADVLLAVAGSLMRE